MACLRHIKSILTPFARNRDGAAAVEFALVAGFLITALVGILELGMIFLVSALMEGGIREAARYGTTGQTPSGKTRAQQIVDIVNSDTLGFLTLTTSNVTTKTYNSFAVISMPETYTDSNHNGKYDTGEPYTDTNGNSQWDADQGKAGVGGAEAIVLYTVTYDWPLMLGTVFPFIGHDGHVTLKASQVIRNEPYAPI